MACRSALAVPATLAITLLCLSGVPSSLICWEQRYLWIAVPAAVTVPTSQLLGSVGLSVQGRIHTLPALAATIKIVISTRSL